MEYDEDFVTEEPEVEENKQYLPCEACTEFFDGLEESGAENLDFKAIIAKAKKIRKKGEDWKDAVKRAAKSMAEKPEEKKPEEEKCYPPKKPEEEAKKPEEKKPEEESLKVLVNKMVEDALKKKEEYPKPYPEQQKKEDKYPEEKKELEQKLSEKNKELQELKESFELFKNQGFKVTRQELSDKKQMTILTAKDGSVCQDLNEYCRWK